MILSYAKDNNLEYIDYFSAMVDEFNGLKTELGIDSVHPNAKGYSVMEPLLEKAINNALKMISKMNSK